MTEPALLTRADLRDQQHFIADQVRNRKAVLIVSAMGSGKTGAALTALRDLLDGLDAGRVLVVAPLRVAQSTWPDEIERWAHTRCISYAVCVGTEAQRRYALAKNAEITIVNREVLVWLAREVGNAANWPWDTLVIDESSMFKAGKKRTAKNKIKDANGIVKVRPGGKMTRFGVLAAARKKIDRVIELTGTPGELDDLWGQIYLLDQGERLGSDRNDFLGRWFDVNPYSRAIEPKGHAKAEIVALIADVMVSLPALELVPPPVFIPVRVQLAPAVMLEYKRFQRTLVSELYDVEAVNKGVLTNKLLQFCNGHLYRDDRSVAQVHTEKLDALDELIERAQDDPVLVVYSFKFDLAAIRKRYPHAVVFNEDADAIRKWNAGEIRLGLAHAASLGHGTNLQYGGHIMIWFGLTWSLELYLQMNARLPRPGQKHVVAIYQIIAEGTADERVLEALERKEATQDAIIESVRAEILTA